MTLWRDKLHEKFYNVTYPATVKFVARQVARKVEPNSTFGNGSCNLSRNDFGRCRVFNMNAMQLVPPPCRQNIARQVARNISQCNSAFRVLRVFVFEIPEKRHQQNKKLQKLTPVNTLKKKKLLRTFALIYQFRYIKISVQNKRHHLEALGNKLIQFLTFIPQSLEMTSFVQD